MSMFELRSESRKVAAWRLGAKPQSRISRHQPRCGAGPGSRQCTAVLLSCVQLQLVSGKIWFCK